MRRFILYILFLACLVLVEAQRFANPSEVSIDESRSSSRSDIGADEIEEEDEGDVVPDQSQPVETVKSSTTELESSDSVPEPMPTQDNSTLDNQDLLQDSNQEEIVSQQTSEDDEIQVNNAESPSITSTVSNTELPSPTVEAEKQPLVGMTFLNKPVENPQSCIVLDLGQGPICLDPKSFGA
ncbi:hypothetical protein K7432_000961 [Basidiobolus ranarum]|uniref:Uncharacterized protein n=1 Tax=Basidiobolus ranarum TaxID=34480 RepID=A0ABR2X3S4_9FUNG